ncbi:serine hydrolase [Mangrovimonas sp. ST2L15]|uniref:serine hydrolase domain-containing protein n=1 Tax=Mangrovimonas sp. ST2L15 TaxID=1645916 RepID=UPI0006B65CA1|nr:serine hydrolase [Mangrovimonas sp. ST2L15]
MKYIIHLLALFILLGCNDKKDVKNNQELNPVTEKLLTKSPKEIGLNDSIFNTITKKIEDQEYTNIHSLLIAKDGKLVYEEYFDGEDKNLGQDLGSVHFTDTTLHDIRSISKSVVSALIGICIDKGLIKHVYQPISDFFPEYEFEGAKSEWTVQQFLTMTTGLDWNENLPYTDPENGEIQMLRSKDPLSYVLNKQLKDLPGTKWVYASGATLVLSEIVMRTSKMPLDQFAKENLFVPLGIEKFEWNKYSHVSGGADIIAAAAGLRLRPRDLMKFALLYRNNGRWNGQQIISERWVNETFKRRITYPCDPGYACVNFYCYQWYSWDDFAGEKGFELIKADGNGGQRIYLDLDNDLTVVMTAGNYNLEIPSEKSAYTLLMKEIYPIFQNTKTR